MIALLDGELMSAGKKQLGWLNPWIYANPDIWTDITEGKNPGPNCTEGGWETAKGWDPVSPAIGELQLILTAITFLVLDHWSRNPLVSRNEKSSWIVDLN